MYKFGIRETSCSISRTTRHKIQFFSATTWASSEIHVHPDGIMLSGRDYLTLLQKTFPPSEPTRIRPEPMPSKSQFPTSDRHAGPRHKEFRTLVGALLYAAANYSPWSLFAATWASTRVSEGANEQYAAAQRIMEYLYTYPVGPFIRTCIHIVRVTHLDVHRIN